MKLSYNSLKDFTPVIPAAAACASTKPAQREANFGSL
jgi:hypothetical protein